jgi:hypothetical protein
MGAILLLALLVILPAAIANALSAIEFVVKAGFFVISWIAAGLLLVAGAGFVLAILAH